MQPWRSQARNAEGESTEDNNMKTRSIAAFVAAGLLAACTYNVVSDPMEAEDGSFLITSSADAYGSQADAAKMANDSARKHCSQLGKRAVAVTSTHQDGSSGGFAAGSSSFHAGGGSAGGLGWLTGADYPWHYDADLRFRCV
jgi:hypothetical protein